MKQHTTIKIMITALLAGALVSCTDFLERNPNDQLSSETATSSLKDARNAVSGFYQDMKWEDYYGSPLTMMGENRGDDLRPRENGSGWWAIYIYGFSPSNNSYSGIWYRCYNLIMRTNTFLANWEHIPASSTSELAEKDDLKGQALAVRALCHFDILRMYSYAYLKPNAPSSLGAVIADRVIAPYEEIPRSTVENSYNFVINDLTAAMPLLSKNRNTGYFNYWAAKALLARVYLYKGDYDNALKEAEEVISGGPYSLVSNSNYLAYWATQGGLETIFELLVTKESCLDSNVGVNSMYNGLWHDGNGAGSLVPTDAWLALMTDPNDIRTGFLRTKNYGGSLGEVTWLAKFPGTDNTDFRINNPRLIRLAEVYLIAAEAALSKAAPDQTKANNYLHAIRSRANPTITTPATATVDLILEERRKEFIGEGQRFFDLNRLGKTIDRTGADHKNITLLQDYTKVEPWDDANYFKVILPIAEWEINANPACVQNKGYVQ